MDKITTKIDLLDRIAEGIDWNKSLQVFQLSGVHFLVF